MTAATAAQVLDKKGSRPIQEAIETGMKANTIAYHGTIAVIDAGYMAPGRAATGLIAVGFFEPGGNDETLTGYDNTNATTGGAAGAINGYARPGCKKLQNSGTDPVAQADVGNDCFIEDDSTISKTDNGATRSRAGKIIEVASDGVFVEIVNTVAQGPTAAPKIQTGTSTLAAGVKTIAAGITVTANTRIFIQRVNGSGTQGDEIRVPTADRTVGAPGTGSLTFRAFLNGVAATSDTSTFEYLLVG